MKGLYVQLWYSGNGLLMLASSQNKQFVRCSVKIRRMLQDTILRKEPKMTCRVRKVFWVWIKFT